MISIMPYLIFYGTSITSYSIADLLDWFCKTKIS